jgi:hypothetical protein
MDDFVGMASTIGFFILVFKGIPGMFKHMESEAVKAGRRGTIDMKTGDFVKRPRPAVDDDEDYDDEDEYESRTYRARRIRRRL